MAELNTYYPGDAVEISTVFTVDDVVTDPTTVTLKVIDPNGTQTTKSGGDFTHTPGTGAYSYVFTGTTVVGIYSYRWVGTGTAAGVDEGGFQVLPSRLA